MHHHSKLQISDLEPIESGVEQELTSEEAKKIVGGLGLWVPGAHSGWKFPPHYPKPPKS